MVTAASEASGGDPPVVHLVTVRPGLSSSMLLVPLVFGAVLASLLMPRLTAGDPVDPVPARVVGPGATDGTTALEVLAGPSPRRWDVGTGLDLTPGSTVAVELRGACRCEPHVVERPAPLSTAAILAMVGFAAVALVPVRTYVRARRDGRWFDGAVAAGADGDCLGPVELVPVVAGRTRPRVGFLLRASQRDLGLVRFDPATTFDPGGPLHLHVEDEAAWRRGARPPFALMAVDGTRMLVPRGPVESVPGPEGPLRRHRHGEALLELVDPTGPTPPQAATGRIHLGPGSGAGGRLDPQLVEECYASAARIGRLQQIGSIVLAVLTVALARSLGPVAVVAALLACHLLAAWGVRRQLRPLVEHLVARGLATRPEARWLAPDLLRYSGPRPNP